MSPKCVRCHIADAEIHLPYAKLSLCPNCFLDYFIRRIKKTVEKYRMFSRNEIVGVAISGGKDSAALLHALRKAFPDQKFVGLHVNLGIPEYSDHCQEKAEELAEITDVDFYVYDLVKEENVRLGDFRKSVFRRKICSVCGTIKRHAFEVLAKRANVKVLATGHNMDDILGFMFNSFFSEQWLQLVRLKPVLPPLSPGMTRKIKPLIRTPERESLLYCLYAEVPYRRMDCPFSSGTKTKERLKIIEILSRENPGIRYQALRSFIDISKILEKNVEKPEIIPCSRCGFPSLDGTCAYCKRIIYIKNVLSRNRTK